MTPPPQEATLDSGQHVYTFLIRILSTSLTSVSIFSVFYNSWYLSRWGAYQRLKTAKKRGLLYYPCSMDRECVQMVLSPHFGPAAIFLLRHNPKECKMLP